MSNTLYNDIIADSNILSGDDYRKLLLTIANIASDMVVKTLGPYGATTVIDDGTGFTYPTKDGWSCLSKFQFTDPTYNTVYNMLKKISFNSVTTVGDGTTTAMVAANHFINRLYNEVIPSLTTDTNKFRQADFLESMTRVNKLLIEELTKNENIVHIDKDSDYSDIYKIAYIATNGNENFSSIIQKIYQETDNPNIYVAMNNDNETSYEIESGYKFDVNVIDYPYYVNTGNDVIDYTDSPRLAVVFDHTVSYQSHGNIIASLSKIASRENTEIVIFAQHFDDIIVSMIKEQISRMIQNNTAPNIMLAQIPITSQLHKASLSDLCAFTNSRIIDESKVKVFNIMLHNATHGEDHQVKDEILSLEKYQFESPEEVLTSSIGRIRSLVFNREEAYIKDYEDIANTNLLNTIIAEATEEYEAAKKEASKTINGTLHKDYLFRQMRYIKLKGNTGTIYVGNISDIQQRCDKDTIDDAVLACKSAFENGYVRGMNIELISKARYILDNIESYTVHEYDEIVLDLIYRSFIDTTLNVMNNKHEDNDLDRTINIAPHSVDISDDIDTDRAITVSQLSLTNNITIIENLITDNRVLDYDLRTETMRPKGEWVVINSSATDIEILKAVTNVLTMVMTSSQLISMTRRFNASLLYDKKMANRLEDEYKVSEAKTQAMIDTLIKNGVDVSSFIKSQNILPDAL